MRLSVRTFAAVLIGLALAAPQIDSDAQNRNSRTSSSKSYSRGSGASASAKRQESRPSGTRPSGNRPSGNKPSMDKPAPNKPSVNKPSGNKPPVKPAPKPGYKPGKPNRPAGVRPPSYRPTRPQRPPVYRPNPPRHRASRPIIIRPSYGTMIAADIAASMAWTAVNIAYFNTVARTYAKAQEAYRLANGLGLVQSYADTGTSYFYHDGVFYVQGTDGQYYVIVPPAGALVETLPEDFEIVVLGGNEYYKVDNTIYRVVINEGKPYFEVLGQMN